MCQWGPQIVHTQPEWAEGDHAFGTVGRDMGGVGTIGTRSRGVLYTEPDPAHLVLPPAQTSPCSAVVAWSYEQNAHRTWFREQFAQKSVAEIFLADAHVVSDNNKTRGNHMQPYIKNH